MPSNPFNAKLAQLNGVAFGADTLGQIDSGQGSVVDSGGNQVPFDSTNSYVKVNSISTRFTAGAINVISYTYVAGYIKTVGYGNVYIPPSFGEIELVGNAYGTTKTFLIRGFTTDGIVLYHNYYGDNRYGGLQGLLNGRGFVLSDDGFAPAAFTLPVTFGYDPSVYVVPVCFAEGTLLATPDGLRAVEALTAGDCVCTAGGAARPIKWVGWMTARPARHARPDEVHPIRVKAHAVAPDVPARDVRLSPGHAVYVDGVLVPVGHLVNGATIVREEVESIRYFHIELDSHDVLLAEGLPCESYLDDGNRASFTNAGEAAALHGRLDPQSWDDACAPLVAAGPQLTEIQQRLHARAEDLGWVCGEDAGLSILVDGVEIAPLHCTESRYWFAVPAAGAVTLRSNCAVLAQVAPGLADTRLLGVAVSDVRVDGVAVALDAEAFGPGFHAIEQHGQLAWRWTDGAATLTLDRDAPAMLEVEIAIVAPSWTRAAPALRIVA